MKVTLLSKPDKTIHPLLQVLLNRGVNPKEINNYLKSNMDNSVVDPAF